MQTISCQGNISYLEKHQYIYPSSLLLSIFQPHVFYQEVLVAASLPQLKCKCVT